MIEAPETLTQEQELFARVMFQNLVLRSNGQRYQDLFVDVMSRRDERFRPVKPQGRIGDQGNDGFIPEEGRYFQVHAPEDPADKSVVAAKKAKDDFVKLQKFWDHEAKIIDYRFVFNDKYQGAYPDIEHALAELKQEYQLQIARSFLAHDLEKEFMSLPAKEGQAVLRTVIPRKQFIDDIDYAALAEILQHLVDSQIPISGVGLPTVPDFSAKIEFNDIDHAGSLLLVGNFQNAAVEAFFNRHSEFARRDIRDRLAQSYQKARELAIDMASENTAVGDRVFFNLLSDIAPNAEKQVQDAAIVLISYFFEKCDVFEDPRS